MNDLTVLYLTANEISDYFSQNTRNHLMVAIGNTPMIVISKKSIPFYVWHRKEQTQFNRYINIVTEGNRSHIGIYRDALEGAKKIKTKYMAFCEDDVLYSPEHFKYRPTPGTFAYNSNCWSIYTWIKPAMFSYKGVRRNNCSLICETELYIETMEERFAKYKDIPDNEINLSTWAEPGRYEGNNGLTVRPTELFAPQPPNIMFSHPTGLSWGNLGSRKKLGDVRAIEIPYWGKAEDILKLYE